MAKKTARRSAAKPAARKTGAKKTAARKAPATKKKAPARKSARAATAKSGPARRARAKTSASAKPAAGAKTSTSEPVQEQAPVSAFTRAFSFGVHPGVPMVQKWITSLKEKTGRAMDEWMHYISREGPKDERARRDWLKNAMGLGTNYAWWLAERSVGKGSEDDTPEAYLRSADRHVRGMFSGARVSLIPIYEKLMDMAHELGSDVKACPCKTMIPLYRNHVFAEIKPASNTRVDLGLALGDYNAPMPPRLIDTGGKEKKDRITHRIPISAASEINAEVRRWMKEAYVLDKRE